MGVYLPTGTLVRTGAERATLVRRTYALVLASILVTIGGAAFGLSQPALMQAVAVHPFIGFLCMIAPLWFALGARRTFPANIGLVFAFTFAAGVILSPMLYVMERTQPGAIGQAAFLTGSSFAVLTLYAWVSRRDFSAWGSFFIVGLWVLIAAMVINFFMHSAAVATWISAVAVLVFSGLLVFDTWRLRNVYGPDDYVAAAVNIYLDLLNMFIYILALLGGGNRRG